MRNPTFPSLRSIPFAAVGALAFAAGCVTGDDESGAEPVGTAQIALSAVPADVGCLRVHAAGVRTVDRGFDVASGQAQLLSLDRLPTGEVTFSAGAFAGACASVAAAAEPGWVSDPVAAMVPRDGVVNVALTMRRNGRASVDITFADDVPPAASPDAGAPPQQTPDAGTPPVPPPDAGAPPQQPPTPQPDAGAPAQPQPTPQPDAGAPPTGQPAPLCEVGQVRCAVSVLQSCASPTTGWQAVKTCAADEICDVATVSCLCRFDSVRCSGSTLMTCGATGAWMSRACGSAALCDAAHARCLVCTPGAKKCGGSGTLSPLQTCAADGLSWTTTSTCVWGCTDGACTAGPSLPVPSSPFRF